MKTRTIYALLIISLFCLPAFGQQPAAPAAEQTVAATPAQQAEVMEALRQEQEAQAAAEAAVARRDTAKARREAVVLRAMAKHKLDPDEWDARLTDKGQLVFERKKAEKR